MPLVPLVDLDRERKSMSTRPPRAVTGCRHGSPLEHELQKAAVQEHLERTEGVSQALRTKYESSATEVPGDHKREDVRDIFDVWEQFWSQPQHSRLIDAKMVRYCFAYAAESALGGQMILSYSVAMLGIYLATWFKLGKDTFLEALRKGLPVENLARQTFLNYQASMDKVGTERGLVLFLSKQLPCSCLDEEKKNAKQIPKSGLCIYCSGEFRKQELKKCSQCKWKEYCSKKCQLADWRSGHKEECEFLKEQREQQVVFKAQTHR